MCKNCNGFTLVEVMLSFFILSVMTSTIIPGYIKVYQERKTILEEQQAQQYITNLLQAWIYDNETIENRKTITIKGTEYVLKTKQNENELELCLTWDGRNAREYSICNYAKKEY